MHAQERAAPAGVPPWPGGKGGVEDKRKCPEGLNVKKSV